MNQPKDYLDEVVIDSMIQHSYKQLTRYQKVWYQVQTNTYLVIASSFLLGYLAGMTFGKFW